MSRSPLSTAGALCASALLGLGSAPVLAGPQCTQEPPAKWLDAAKFRAELEARGYAIAKFKTTSGHCYEIYGKDKTGAKVEIYFDPVDGKIIKQERP
jgi:Uncharacterized conserved protein